MFDVVYEVMVVEIDENWVPQYYAIKWHTLILPGIMCARRYPFEQSFIVGFPFSTLAMFLVHLEI